MQFFFKETCRIVLFDYLFMPGPWWSSKLEKRTDSSDN